LDLFFNAALALRFTGGFLQTALGRTVGVGLGRDRLSHGGLHET
jgi:hypothetical protein